MIQPPHISIQVDTWIGALVALGLIIPMAIAALGGGYILGGFVLDRFSRTVMGTHIRHFFVRIAPMKRFDEGDRDYIVRIVEDQFGRRRINLKELSE